MTTRKKTGGRTKGTPNHTTKDIREAYQLLIKENIDNMSYWIKKIATKDPEKAFNIILKMSEYIIPKLNKTEMIEKPEDKYENMTDEEINNELKKLRIESGCSCFDN